jgi:hypothetical protein
MDTPTGIAAPSNSGIWGGFVLCAVGGVFLSTILIFGVLIGIVPLLIAAGLTVLGVKVAGSEWVALGVVGGIGIFVMLVAGVRGFDPGSTTWFAVGAGLLVISSLGCSIGMRRTRRQRVGA